MPERRGGDGNCCADSVGLLLPCSVSRPSRAPRPWGHVPWCEVSLLRMGRRQGGLGLQSRAPRCAGESFKGGANVFASSFLFNSFGVAQSKAMVGTEQLHYRVCIAALFLKVKELQRETPKRRGLCLITLIIPVEYQDRVHTGLDLADLDANERRRSSGQQLWGCFHSYM